MDNAGCAAPPSETRIPNEPAGAVGTRLSVVLVAAVATFFQQGLLSYMLPLYFPARGLPSSAWEEWGTYLILGWLSAPVLTWLLARRIGERRVWALGLAVTAAVCVWLAIFPVGAFAWAIAVGSAGFIYGSICALLWISGMSLVQRVPETQRGRANSLMMVALGVGSIAAPTLGRLALAVPQRFGSDALSGFIFLLWASAVLSLLGGVLIHFWGEYPSPSGAHPPVVSVPSLMDDFNLIRSPRFLLMVIPISFLAGPIFQANNVYLAYRASEPYIGLIRHGHDHGWVTLQVINYAAQLIGGIMLWLVAGRRASAWVAAAILCVFALCSISIGIAQSATALFISAAAFELGRQFMRWLQTGYVSESVPVRQHSAAISVSILLSALGGAGFMLLSRWLQSPDSSSFSSTLPFLVAGSAGIVGVLILLISARREQNATNPVGSGDISADE